MITTGPTAIESVPSVPWKNGGGTTRTLASHPPASGLDAFQWRISLAEITASGAFSSFPGIDRTILLWRGEGMVLHSPAWLDQALTEPCKPFAFRGEEEVIAALLGGTATDLNLMARRGAANTTLTSHTTTLHFNKCCEALFILCHKGEIQLPLRDNLQHILKRDQFLLIQHVDAPITIETVGPTVQFVCVAVYSPGQES